MKNSIRLLAFFVILFSLPIILESCSSESTLTSPLENKSNTTAMSKTLDNSVATINHSIDTVITLPKSKISVVVNKNLSIDKITIMDDYYSTHTISTTSKSKTSPTPQSISPNYRWCPYHTDTILVLQNQYKQVPGKYLGIWTDKVDWTKLHDQYGFTNILTDFTGAVAADSAHFQQDSIMIDLGYNATWNDINNNPPYKYYFVDEPVQNTTPDIVTSYSIEINMKNPLAKLLLGDYYWPSWNLPCLTLSDDGFEMTSSFLVNSNTYIICDMYNGTQCGDVHSYWDEYKAYYGIPSKNLTNWITLEPGHSPDWGDLLNVAMAWSYSGAMNPIWMYGLDNNVSESTISGFCTTAWQTGWLLRLQGQLVEVWQNTDGTCNWETGSWTLINSYYIGYQYTSY